MPLIVIMTTYHRPRDLERSLTSILLHTPQLELLHLIDNSMGKIDETLNKITDTRVQINRNPTNLGKSRSYQQHYHQVVHDNPLDHFVGIDADIEVGPDWYPELLRAARTTAPWAAIAPRIQDPGSDHLIMHVTGPQTREVTTGVWYTPSTAGSLFLIRRKFWESWGGYPPLQRYGQDDGALCREAIRRQLFIGWTDRVVVQHHNSDSDQGYRDWKQRNITGDKDSGYWDPEHPTPDDTTATAPQTQP